MSEYDAFGRRKDEAGLGDLGWGATGETEPAAETRPSVSATPTDSGFSSPAEFTSVPVPPPARRRGPRLGLLLVQLLVLGGIGYGIYVAVDAGNEAADRVRDTFGSLGAGQGAGGGAAEGVGGRGGGGGGGGKVPAQVAGRELFTAAGLKDAIRVMERELPGKLTVLSIRRDRINATVIAGGEQHFVNFQADAQAPEVLSSTSAAAAPDTFTYGELDLSAPARLIKASNARVNRSSADVDYVTASSFSGPVMWGVYYRGGKPITQGDARGRYLRRIS